jgi:quercetin dioxygenase-like cupin family protein
MKKSILIPLLFVSLFVFSQKDTYHLTSYLDLGTKAPNTRYIGEAWLNPLIYNDQELSYHITKATFSANSTLDWHKHNSAQVLIIVDGEAYYQEKGKEPLILKQGDVIKCEKGKEHWHSSTKNSDVTYLALYDGEQPTIWTKVVTQEYYNSIANKLGHSAN